MLSLSAFEFPDRGKVAFIRLLCLAQEVAGIKTRLNAGKLQMMGLFKPRLHSLHVNLYLKK